MGPFSLAIALLLVAAPALGGPIYYRSRWLVVDGAIAPKAWIAARESFIRDRAREFASLHPRVPVAYHLDADFVAAARARESIAVVDDCHGRDLCGVATDEIPEGWDAADLRALFTSSDESPMWRAAFVSSLSGRFGGEEVERWAADVVRSGVVAASRRPVEGDDRIVVPLLASMIRFVDPRHHASSTQARVLVDALSDDDLRRWRTAMLAVPRIARAAPRLPVHGAAMSVVNRIDRHLIADGSREELQRLHALGFNAIALMPFAGQRALDSNEMRRFDRRPSGETDLSMIIAATRAHRLGMAVMLKPQVWPFGSGDATRIQPSDFSKWFDSYEEFIIHAALVAREARAEWFSIGTELTHTENRSEWLHLIRVVRTLYPGAITYAANFDAFESTPFWRELDAIGVDAYFPLSAKPDATDDELRRGAEQVVRRLEAISRRAGKPLIATEIGYPTTDAPWIEPWREQRDRPASGVDQARAFDAVLGALSRSPAVAGFFIWKYESDPNRTDGAGYLPRNKPSERVIRRYLTQH